jgi:flavin-dependent dehydrogenase
MNKKYDAIIIGARCAGSPTAMLLARKGYKVLLLDKAEFPSDTISTHIIFLTGVERLKRWGMLEEMLATNCPVIKNMAFDFGDFSLRGEPVRPDGVPGIIAPRRFILDAMLVGAAVDAGAELREGCLVESLIVEDGTVKGVRCKTKAGKSETLDASIVIGADGKHSLVAKTMNATIYNAVPPSTCWYYSYWSNVSSPELILYSRPGRAMGTIATNNGLSCVVVACTAAELKEFRTDIEGNYMKALSMVPELEERVRKGNMEERFSAMSDLPGFFRHSYGPGWALVGDAGYHKDPITGQGISDAFREAESLADAIDKGLSGKDNLASALAQYQQRRDEESMPMYGFTCEWAQLEPPPPAMQAVFKALRNNQPDTDQFFSTMAGTVPIPVFFAPENLQRITNSS